MSWQAYVDTNLIGTGKIKDAAIHGAADGALWATSKGFNVRVFLPVSTISARTTNILVSIGFPDRSHRVEKRFHRCLRNSC